MTLVRFKNDRTAPRAFNDLFDDFFTKDFPSLFAPSAVRNTPAVNVLETKEGFRVDMALPGVNKENIAINVENNLLTVSAKNETKQNEEKENYTRREFSYSSFERTFTLPETVNADAIAADYVDGILKISIPKKEEVKDKGAKSIKIS